MKYAAAAAIAALCAGCAQNPKDIAPAYVSPIIYENLSCTQIAEEFRRVAARVNQVAGVQTQQAKNDAVAMGVGLVLFWPAVFFIKGDKQNAAELARLRGELDALQQAAVRKNCGIQFQGSNS
jgi:hypothetical protein